MRTLLAIAACACMCACASRQTQSTAMEKYYYNPVDSLPPSSFPELTVSDHRTVKARPPVVEVDEQTKYTQSLAHIRKTFRDEVLILTMCVDSHSDDTSECASLKKKMCEVDQLIDSKGDHHSKPYCWH